MKENQSVVTNINKLDNSSFNSDLFEWLKTTTNIPIYLPNIWEPILDNQNNQTYYFETSGNIDSYNINVYRTNVSVKFNDLNNLLEKNGPVSESDYIGTISGGLYDSNDFTFKKPKTSESFELISGISAYKIKEGELVWSENSWNFHYVGMPVNQDKKEMLIDLASTWSGIEICNFKIGKVEIVEGNKLTINYDWVKDDYQYSYITKGTDFEGDLKIINSFTKID